MMPPENILEKLMRSSISTTSDAEYALREVIQEIALLGLSRGDFFSCAAFYGGTALRIFHGLDRFSEDMDFSLISPNDSFDISRYENFMTRELSSFGLDVSFERHIKSVPSNIESAFLKANTRVHIMRIGNASLAGTVPANKTIRIKLEIDIDPPLGFETEIRYCLHPLPFSVRVYKQPDLFAGKCHALLCREWKGRVKGRDWYDLTFYVSKGTPLHIAHLEARMRQSGHLNETLTPELFLKLMTARIERLDVESARVDVERFIPHERDISIWSREFFSDILRQINFC